jgi:monoamine oxidase
MDAEATREVDVLVVGAGLAGLSAARALVAAGAATAVVEARDRVGGRTLSRAAGRGVFDLGAQYVGPDQARLRRLARELAVETAPTPHAGRKWLELAGRRSSYAGAIPGLPPLALLQLQLVIRRLDRAIREVPPASPWSAARARAWDAHTAESWWSRFTFGRSVRAILRQTTRMTFGAESDEMSFLSFLHYLSAAGGLLHMTSIAGGSQQDHFVGGSQQLSQRLAESLGERVVLRAPVRRIVQDGAGARVHTDRGEWRARCVVVAIPPLLAGRIAYEPEVPAARSVLVQRFPMGAAIKCIALYERAFWRERGFSGEAISDRGAVGFVLDTSHGSSQPALVAFIEGAPARAWSGRPAQERRRAVLRDLAGIFGPEAEQASDYLDQDWIAEPWTGGCSAGFTTPGTLSRFGPALREPVGCIHWAGTETASEWFGYMEGALESGERAAREVLSRLGSAGSG